MYLYKPSSATAAQLGEIRRHLNRCDPANSASIAGLIEYSINRTIEHFRDNPAQLLADYKNHQQEKAAQQTT